jgi:predicted membrane chloride channel (bestrophin family)
VPVVGEPGLRLDNETVLIYFYLRYERYWLGRGYWSDIVKHSRTVSRLIWFHVPLRLSPKTPEEVQSGQSERSVKEMSKVMAEKKMALDLLYG